MKPFGVKVGVMSSSTYKDRAKEASSEKQKTNESVDSINQREESPYYIVSKNMNQNNFQTGYQLCNSILIKFPAWQSNSAEFSTLLPSTLMESQKLQNLYQESALISMITYSSVSLFQLKTKIPAKFVLTKLIKMITSSLIPVNATALAELCITTA